MHLDRKEETFSQQVRKFTLNSKRFVRTCKRPPMNEFVALTKGHIIGLCFLGIFGYIIKVIHIPINNIIAGSS